MHWQFVTLALILVGLAAILRRIEGTPVAAPMVFTAPLAKRYADWHDARVAETPVESGEEEELRWRLEGG